MSQEQATRLALAHHQAGQLVEAEEMYREILRQEAGNGAVWNLLGALLAQTERKSAAVEAFREAVRLAPQFAETHYHLGNALAETGAWEEAEKHCRAALKLKPHLGQAHLGLAAALEGQGKADESLRSLREAVRLMPGHAKALNNLGLALVRRRKLDEGMAAFGAAIRAKGDYAEAHLNLGMALEKRGRLDEAIARYREAVRHRPHHGETQRCLWNAVSTAGRTDEALAGYRQALEMVPGDAGLHSGYLFALNYGEGTGDEHFLSARRWAMRHAEALGNGARTFANVRDPQRRIRVGYVSADLMRHPVAQFLRPILAHHDADKVEVFIYSCSTHADAITAALRRQAAHWREAATLDDEALAARIREDGIDVLVDLSGHSSPNRLLTFARRPAPVQVTYLGHCATTGMGQMDYLLTDGVLDEPADEGLYSEKLLRLEGCFCCYWVPRDEKELELEPGMSGALEVAEAPAARNGFITFGSFHALKKLNDGVLDLWARVLQAVPHSRLLVYRNVLQGREQERLRARFAARGIGAERLAMEYAWPAGRYYLARYDEIDIQLDTFPWSGHTTTCEAMWMGVPTITLLGDRHAGRMSATVLRAAGLEAFIAHTPEAFVDIARRWGERIPELQTLRAGMRQRMGASALCDGERFTKGLEEAYRDIWARWCLADGE